MNAPLRDLGADVAKALDETLSDDRRRRAVLQRLKSEERVVRLPSRSQRPQLVVGSLGLAAAAAILLIVWPRDGQEELSYRVADGQVARHDSSTIQADTQPVELRFSDRSRMELLPGSRGRVSELSADGAVLTLDRGEVDVFVRHRASSRWSVRAGPYRVSVTGTRFRVGWQPKDRAFDLQVFEGEVRVRGPGLEDRAVRGGEKLRERSAATEATPDPSPSVAPSPPATDPAATRTAAARRAPESTAASPARSAQSATTPPSSKPSVAPRTQSRRSMGAPTPPRRAGSPSSFDAPSRPTAPPLELRLPDKTPKPPLSPQPRQEPPGEPPPASQPDPTREPEAPAPTPTIEEPPAAPPAPPQPAEPETPRWEPMLEREAYKDAIEKLPPAEIDAAIRQANADQLLSLGTAARLLDDHRSELIYNMLRSRFPGSDQAADAAFMLGRMDFHAHAYASAAAWLETYLRENPDGRFARGATGRLIEAYDRLGDRALLRSAATRYLSRYPDGPHAARAREALE